MDYTMLFDIYKGVISNEGFKYSDSYIVESKEKNFYKILSKVGEGIGNKDYSDEYLDSYDKEKYNIYIHEYGDVIKYPKEIDLLDALGLRKMVAELDLERLKDMFISLDLKVLTSKLSYDEIDNDITFRVIEMELISGTKTKELILEYLLNQFNNETQYTLSKFYEIIVTNYQGFGGDDGVLIIDSFTEVSYKAVFGALLYFYYTGDIELLEHDSKSFRIKLLAFEDKLIGDSNEDLQLIIDNEISPQLKEMITSGDKELERIFIDFNKDGEPKMLIRQLNIDSNKYNEVTLKKKYPFSKIITENHQSKSNKSVVFAKTKLNSKEK